MALAILWVILYNNTCNNFLRNTILVIFIGHTIIIDHSNTLNILY